MTTNRPCPDCGAAVGTPHTASCDVARCLVTGAQRLQHELPTETLEAFGFPAAPEHDCGQDVWTGTWPNEDVAAEHGWYVRWDATPHTEDDGVTYPGRWVKCSADHPDEQPDLNRVLTECVWNPDRQRFVLPDTQESA